MIQIIKHLRKVCSNRTKAAVEDGQKPNKDTKLYRNVLKVVALLIAIFNHSIDNFRCTTSVRNKDPQTSY